MAVCFDWIEGAKISSVRCHIKRAKSRYSVARSGLSIAFTTSPSPHPLCLCVSNSHAFSNRLLPVDHPLHSAYSNQVTGFAIRRSRRSVPGNATPLVYLTRMRNRFGTGPIRPTDASRGAAPQSRIT
jgi:hypothetical protein